MEHDSGQFHLKTSPCVYKKIVHSAISKQYDCLLSGISSNFYKCAHGNWSKNGGPKNFHKGHIHRLNKLS